MSREKVPKILCFLAANFVIIFLHLLYGSPTPSSLSLQTKESNHFDCDFIFLSASKDERLRHEMRHPRIFQSSLFIMVSLLQVGDFEEVAEYFWWSWCTISSFRRIIALFVQVFSTDKCFEMPLCIGMYLETVAWESQIWTS